MAPIPKAISTMLAAIPPYWRSLRIPSHSLWLRWLVTAAIGSFCGGPSLRRTARKFCGKSADRRWKRPVRIRPRGGDVDRMSSRVQKKAAARRHREELEANELRTERRRRGGVRLAV